MFCNRNRCRTSCLKSFRYGFKTLSIRDRAYNVASKNTDLTNQIVCKLAKWKYLVLRKRFFNKFTYWHHHGHASSSRYWGIRIIGISVNWVKITEKWGERSNFVSWLCPVFGSKEPILAEWVKPGAPARESGNLVLDNHPPKGFRLGGSTLQLISSKFCLIVI